MTTLARHWCFTLNNPSEDEVLVPQSWEADSYRYLVYQLEEGENKTKHLQGYVSLPKAIRFGSFKKWFPGERAHIEVAKGSAKQNQKYCTKQEGRLDGPWEFGVLPESGKRSDLLAVKEMLDNGCTFAEISQEKFPCFIRYHRSFKEYLLVNAPQHNDAKEIHVFWGPSGSGKSRTCWERWPNAYWKTQNSGEMQFFDGYINQSTLVIDEFFGWIKWGIILRITDRYPCNLDTKHGTVPASPSTVVFTSNHHPSTWYNWKKLRIPEWDTFQSNGMPCNPLQRRITSVTALGEVGETNTGMESRQSDNGLASIDNSEENRLINLYLRK